MKIENIVMDGSGLNRFKWYWYCEWRYWIFCLFPTQDAIFLEGCTIKNFHAQRWELVFWLARLINDSLEAQAKQQKV